MRLSILTLFPEYFQTPFQTSILKRALEGEATQIDIINIRDYATDKRKTTDDRPYSGGPGMVMKVEPIYDALKDVLKMDPIEHVRSNRGKVDRDVQVILTSAKGKVFTQASAQQYSSLKHLVIICGHYEGVDERVAENLVDEEVRIGDYVLTGGEPAAAVMTDAVIRLLPGVLGNEESTVGESHSRPGFLAHAQYTRPVEFKGWKVPEILLSGHHGHITEWRKQTSPEQSPHESNDVDQEKS